MSARYQTRDLVLPGDVLYEGRIRAGENTYRVQDYVYATHLGLVNYGQDTVSVVALHGRYQPFVGDIVVGEVIDIELGEWVIEIGSQETAILSIQEAVDRPFRTDFIMTKIFTVGDTIVAKIVDFDRKRAPILSILGPGLGKMSNGFIIGLNPAKIPRLIGKKGSMINMIIKETGCRVNIGQNGRILVSGPSREREIMVEKVIDLISQQAHTSGLTNRTQEFLKKMREELR